MSEQQQTPHTARTRNLCASLRHPAQRGADRALTKHLAEHPFPKQAGAR